MDRQNTDPNIYFPSSTTTETGDTKQFLAHNGFTEPKNVHQTQHFEQKACLPRSKSTKLQGQRINVGQQSQHIDVLPNMTFKWDKHFCWLRFRTARVKSRRKCECDSRSISHFLPHSMAARYCIYFQSCFPLLFLSSLRYSMAKSGKW